MEEQITKILGDKLLEAARVAEEQLDQELTKLDALSYDDLEELREKRLKQMQLEAKRRQEWKIKGHGAYTELSDQKEFFEISKKSRRVVVHFYRPATWRCEIVDKHLGLLAVQHLEARFVKINVEKAPFLVERLNIWMLPTILLIKDGKTEEKIEGFDKLGGTDNFSTRTLEAYIVNKKILDSVKMEDNKDSGGEESDED